MAHSKVRAELRRDSVISRNRIRARIDKGSGETQDHDPNKAVWICIR